MADAGRLRQVLVNLAGNGLKFSREGGVVVTCALAYPDRLAIAIRDTGVGIAAEDLERIFDDFEQTEPASRKAVAVPGSGLPFRAASFTPWAARLAVKSRPGHGSTFTVVLPLKASRPAPDAVGTACGQACRRCFAVAGHTHLPCGALRDAGAKVALAHDGQGLRRRLAGGAPDAVLVDNPLADEAGAAGAGNRQS